MSCLFDLPRENLPQTSQLTPCTAGEAAPRRRRRRRRKGGGGEGKEEEEEERESGWFALRMVAGKVSNYAAEEQPEKIRAVFEDEHVGFVMGRGVVEDEEGDGAR
eukprot:767772-Hanusia_phi.AAC.1